MWFDGRTLYVQSNILLRRNKMVNWKNPFIRDILHVCCWSAKFTTKFPCWSLLSTSFQTAICYKTEETRLYCCQPALLQRNFSKKVFSLFGRLNEDKIGWDIFNLNICLTTIDSFPPFYNVKPQSIKNPILWGSVETMQYISFLKYVCGIWYKYLYWNYRSTSTDNAGRATQIFYKAQLLEILILKFTSSSFAFH